MMDVETLDLSLAGGVDVAVGRVLVVAALAVAVGAVLASEPTSAATTRLEAEAATISQGVVESNHGGFSGTGFVNYANVTGGYVQWTMTMAEAGAATLAFRYANGTGANRPMDIVVNGTLVSDELAFAGTGTWTAWRTVTTRAVNLNAGTNTIRATATTSAGGPNLDYLELETGGTGNPSVPLTDPLPDPVQSNLGLVLTEFASFPKSEPTPTPTDNRLVRWARINYLGELPDGSGRLYVPDLNGNVYFVRPGQAPTVYLNVRAAVGANFFSGRGLGSGAAFVTFDPGFATNGRFYTTHTEAGGALTGQTPDWTQANAVVHSVVTEWTAGNPAANTFSGTRRTLMRIGFANYPHSIQQVEFNPTAQPGSADHGLLYIAVGDGYLGYTNNHPQDLRIPHGKILRIDPRGTNSANGDYGIPASNPFLGRPNTLGEIYAYGLRDPHRFSWDRGPGNRLFLGSIGEHDIESVYDVRAGDNFGWSEREGPFVFKKTDRCNVWSLPENDASFGYTYPVAAYDHNPPAGFPCTSDVGRAISGGFVYRGTAFPALTGKYVFGDIVNGHVYYTNASEMQRGAALATIRRLRIYTAAGAQTTMAGLAGDSRVDLRLGMDRTGDLYLLAKANGRVWKVTGTRGTAP
jgi:glucose/arabinose dehydrogenase